jgi:hypothetical protein
VVLSSRIVRLVVPSMPLNDEETSDEYFVVACTAYCNEYTDGSRISGALHNR